MYGRFLSALMRQPVTCPDGLSKEEWVRELHARLYELAERHAALRADFESVCTQYDLLLQECKRQEDLIGRLRAALAGRRYHRGRGPHDDDGRAA